MSILEQSYGIESLKWKFTLRLVKYELFCKIRDFYFKVTVFSAMELNKYCSKLYPNDKKQLVGKSEKTHKTVLANLNN